MGFDGSRRKETRQEKDLPRRDDHGACVPTQRSPGHPGREFGRAVFSPIFANAVRPANIARFILDPASQEFYVEWERLAGDTVALLRAGAGRDPYDRALSDLIGELSTRSETFRTLWAAHNVRLHRSGVEHLHHPVVGDLTLMYESMELTADVALRLNAYTAEPGTPSQDSLNLLASWTAADIAGQPLSSQTLDGA